MYSIKCWLGGQHQPIWRYFIGKSLTATKAEGQDAMICFTLTVGSLQSPVLIRQLPPQYCCELWWHSEISHFITITRFDVKNILWIYYAGDVINANLFQVLIAVCTALYNALQFLLQPEAISQAVLILFVVQLEQISISQHRGGLGWGNQMTKLIL